MATVIRENGRVVEVQQNGKTVWNREKELKKVAEAASKAATEEAQSQGKTKPSKAAEKARQKLKEVL